MHQDLPVCGRACGSYVENEDFSFGLKTQKTGPNLKMYSAQAHRGSQKNALPGQTPVLQPGAYAHSDVTAKLLASRVRGTRLTIRQTIFLILDEPSSGRFAAYWSVIMSALVLFSAAASTLETLQYLHDWFGTMTFLVLKFFFNIWFTLEASLRVATFTPLRRLWRSPILWLDVITNLPFWLRLALLPETLTIGQYLSRATHSTSALSFAISVLDSLTSLRLLKLARYYEGAGLLARAVVLSVRPLLVPMFMLLVMVVCFSFLLFELEWSDEIDRCQQLWEDVGVSATFLRKHRAGVTWDCTICEADPGVGGSNGGERQTLCSMCNGYPDGHPECLGVRWEQHYPDIPTAMWFIVVTVTPAVKLDPFTYPGTWRGKFFCILVIVLGILFLAMPLSTVGGNFMRVWEQRNMLKLQRLVRQLLLENDLTPDDALIAFQQFDTNNDGEITHQEFIKCVTTVLGLSMSMTELNELWRDLDDDRNGAISITEFSVCVSALDQCYELLYRPLSDHVCFNRVRVLRISSFPTRT